MEAAIQTVQWFKREALRIIEAMRGETAQVDLEERAILDVVRRKGEATAREIVQFVRSFRGTDCTERAEAKMEAMVQKGLLTYEDRKANNGAMVRYYSLSPVNAKNVNAVSENTENGVDGVDTGFSENLTTIIPDANDTPNGVDKNGVDSVDEEIYEAAMTEEPPLTDVELEMWFLGAAE
jgi:hypothetical protein